MLREGHNKVLESSSIVSVLGQQRYNTTKNSQCLVLHAIMLSLSIVFTVEWLRWDENRNRDKGESNQMPQSISHSNVPRKDNG